MEPRTSRSARRKKPSRFVSLESIHFHFLRALPAEEDVSLVEVSSSTRIPEVLIRKPMKILEEKIGSLGR